MGPGMSRRARSLWLLAVSLVFSTLPMRAEDQQSQKDTKSTEAPAVELTQKWLVLFNASRRLRNGPLPLKSKIQNLKELSFTGPEPGHPFVIGDYAEDGEFGLVNNGLQRISGQNASLQLPFADQFELEGMMEQTEFGGWFMLVGWEDGRGYLLSNATMKESGSPWFLSELRGGTAVPEGTKHLVKYEWLRAQPFQLTVKDKQISFSIGERNIINQEPMDNYAPGQVILGVYDTRYGPKKIHISSLRMRAVAGPNQQGQPDAAPAK